jgi:hypothetical protein
METSHASIPSPITAATWPARTAGLRVLAYRIGRRIGWWWRIIERPPRPFCTTLTIGASASRRPLAIALRSRGPLASVRATRWALTITKTLKATSLTFPLASVAVAK